MASGERLWPFVGRDVELASVTAALISGQGAVVRGAAGVGKSRLVDEVLEVVAAGPGRVHRVAGIPALATTPLGALVPLVGTAYGAAASARLSEVLSDGGARGPGRPVLAVDDAHLLDPVSAGLVHQSATSGWATVVLTVRSGEPVPAGLERVWSAGRLKVVELDAVDPGSMAALVRAALPGPVEAGTSAALVRAAHGNVLYLRELIEGSISAGVLTADAGVWRLMGDITGTLALRDIVAARLHDLDVDAREAVEVLAVAGAVPLSVLADLVDADVLEGLERKRLVRVLDGDGEPVVDLAHPLHGEVLRQALPALARLRISRRLVRAATARGAPPAGFELRVATWLLAAGPAEAGVAPALLEDLALRAVEVGDTRLAAALAEAAFETGDRLAPALLAGWCRAEQGDHEGAEGLFARAAERSRVADLGSVDRASVAMEWASLRWWAGHGTAASVTLLDEARAAGGDGADLVAAQMAIFDSLDGRAAAAIERAGPLVDHPVDVVAAVAAAGLAPALAVADRPEEARAVAAVGYERAMAVRGLLPGNPGVHVVSQIFAAVVDGAVHDADAFAALVSAGAASQPSRQARAWAALMAATVALLAGRLGEAHELSLQSDVLWRDVGVPGMARWAGTQCALAALERGDRDAAVATLASHRDLTAEGFRFAEPRWHQARAWVAWLGGRRGEAIDEVLTGADAAARGGAVTMELECLHLPARWGVAAEAAKVLDRAESLSVGAALSRLRREHLRAIASGDASALEEVAERFTSTGTRTLAAEAWAQTSKAYARAGRPKHAERAAARSAAVVDELAPTDRPATPALARRHHQGLSRREAEVASLAAGGRTNREIADELVVSERTVENHLYRVFTKLGVRTRKELADTYVG